MSAVEAAPTLGVVFEGLPWGATESQIREVFGSKLSKVQCTDTEKVSQAARPGAFQCDSPIVNDYTIDGITFRAYFNMGGPNDTLNEIRLDRVATVTNDQIKAGEGAEYRFNRVKAELVRRYGEPLGSGKSQKISNESLTVLAEKWVADKTVVSMTDTVIPDKRGQMYLLTVVYTPLDEAIKSQIVPPK
ncbi:hypothetical protein GCM10007235_20330 [Pseudoxanthomonas indica]|nr:hypothetical protein GCM10007235_20330 [Pseudoxanthomonas indica]